MTTGQTARPVADLTATAYGRRVGLRLDGADLADVRPWLPHWWDLDAPPVAPERTWVVAGPADAERAVGELELWVAEHAEGLVFVHAGVVAAGGRALLLPGRSLAGKTTLTAALVRAGAAYGSDEYAPLSPDGLVHPYPRPLWVRGPAGRRQVPVTELGGAPLEAPVPVAAVALVRHEPGGRFAPEPLPPAQAVLALLDNTVPARTRPAEALDALTAAVRGADPALLLRSARGEADEAAAALLALLAGG